MILPRGREVNALRQVAEGEGRRVLEAQRTGGLVPAGGGRCQPFGRCVFRSSLPIPRIRRRMLPTSCPALPARPLTTGRPEAGANVFFGNRNHTFFGQLEDNSNVYFVARSSF